MAESLLVAHELTEGQVAARAGTPVDRLRHIAAVRATIDAILDHYCRLKQKTHWCEKTPQNLDYLNYLNVVFPDALCICLHRDGFDAVRSWLEARVPAGKRGGQTVSTYVDQWCRRTERLLAFETCHSDRTIRVTYERLVAEPELEMRRVCDFLRIPRLTHLASDALAAEHDDGPGCYKIRGSDRIEVDRGGHGREMDFSRLPAATMRRMDALQRSLGYC